MSQSELTGEEARFAAQSDIQKEHARYVSPWATGGVPTIAAN